MSMRTYGIETKGVALKLSEFTDLLKRNIDTIKGISREDIEDENYDEIIDFSSMIDYATYYGEVNGYIDTEKGDRIYFDYEDIILLELKKNSLFDKYENQEEIYNELIDTLKKVGINVDRDYIIKHYGYINGTETS